MIMEPAEEGLVSVREMAWYYSMYHPIFSPYPFKVSTELLFPPGETELLKSSLQEDLP